MNAAPKTQAMNTRQAQAMTAAPKTQEACKSTMGADYRSGACTFEQSRIGCVDVNGACMIADNFEMKYNACPNM